MEAETEQRLRRYRFRAYPTRRQEAALARLFGCVRVVYNDAVAFREKAHEEGKQVGPAETGRNLTTSKSRPERAWLNDVSAVPLQQSVRDADAAYRLWFRSLRGETGKRFEQPKFKTKHARQSARFTKNAGWALRQTAHGVGHVRLPKVGQVRFALSRPIPEGATSVTVIRDSDGRHYVSFVAEAADPDEVPVEGRREAAGVDLGLTDLLAVVYSDGTREKVDNPRWFRRAHRRLAVAQRAADRCVPGSRNDMKARARVAAQHRKVRDTRLDHHHKLALRLVRENQAVALEGLSVSGLAQGRLAKSVHDAGWGLLVALIQQKAPRVGTDIRVIGRYAPTSQVCAVCGALDGKKALSVRVWECKECGARLDRDWNAALNVLVAAGLAETLNARGREGRLRLAEALSPKQEPAERKRALPGRDPSASQAGEVNGVENHRGTGVVMSC